MISQFNDRWQIEEVILNGHSVVFTFKGNLRPKQIDVIVEKVLNSSILV